MLVKADIKLLDPRVVKDMKTDPGTLKTYEFPDADPSVLDLPGEFGRFLIDNSPEVFSVYTGDEPVVEGEKTLAEILDGYSFDEIKAATKGRLVIRQAAGNSRDKADDGDSDDNTGESEDVATD